jgi:hypothetical protein
MSSRFVRLRRIRELLAAGLLDDMLRRQSGGGLRATEPAAAGVTGASSARPGE